jgi:hypothetical protein
MFITYNSTTLSNTASRVLSFIEKGSDLFLSLSRSYEWSEVDGKNINDTNPPRPSSSLVRVEDLVTMVRVYEALPALLSPCGETEVLGNKWHIIRDLNSIRLEKGAFTPSPTHLYISCLIEPDYYQSSSIRTIGLHSRVTLSAGSNPNEISFPPSQVLDQGILHWVAYSTPIDRLINKKHKMELLLEL